MRRNRPKFKPHANPRRMGPREAVLATERNPIKRVFKILGPGLISGSSDADPTSIVSYAKSGASVGPALLWAPVACYPLMAAVQFVCSKIGLSTGMGLAAVLRRHGPTPLLYLSLVVLVISNVATVGADIGAIAAAINLVSPLPINVLVVPITLLIIGLLFFGNYRQIEATFKWLTLSLFTYIAAAFFARPDWGATLAATFVPTARLDSEFLSNLVAVFGTSISPYLFFWQASQEVEDEIAMGRTRLCERRGTSDTELRAAALDINVGMFFYNLVTYFIMLATAATLFKVGRSNLNTAAEVASALRPLAGPAAEYLLAAGLIGSGFLAVPVIASSSAFAIAEAFDWPYGLEKRPREAKRFYGVIAGSMLAGMLVNFSGINPIDMLFWSSILNGFLTPPLLAVLMLSANNRAIMGERTNGWLTNFLGWAAVAVLALSALALVFTWIRH